MAPSVTTYAPPVAPEMPSALLDVPHRVLVTPDQPASGVRRIVHRIASAVLAYVAAVRSPRPDPHPDALEDAWEGAYWPHGHPIDGHPCGE